MAFHPSNLLQRHLWLGNYGDLSSGLRRVLIWGTTLPYFAMLAVIGFAIRRTPRTPMNAALLLLALYQAAVIFITFGNTRFRLPIIVIGMILTAWLPGRALNRTD